jgi:hypothetical protein
MDFGRAARRLLVCTCIQILAAAEIEHGSLDCAQVCGGFENEICGVSERRNANSSPFATRALLLF